MQYTDWHCGDRLINLFLYDHTHAHKNSYKTFLMAAFITNWMLRSRLVYNAAMQNMHFSIWLSCEWTRRENNLKMLNTDKCKIMILKMFN